MANSLAAVREGVDQVQGTINGYRRAVRQRQPGLDHPDPGAQDGARLHPRGPSARAARLARFAAELANRKPWAAQPYVGDSAFAHKGGMHVSAVLKHPETYEHVSPEDVGNHRRVLVSELAGQSNIV